MRNGTATRYVWSGQPWEIDDGPFVPQYALWLAANGEY